MSHDINDYDIAPGAFNLRDLMQNTLDRTVALFAQYNMPLPSRQFWSMGTTVAQDCEQLTVTFDEIFLGTPGDQGNRPVQCAAPRTATMTITITRKYPIGVNGKAPTPASIMQYSEFGALDAWLLIDNVKVFDVWGPNGENNGLGVVATVNSGDVGGGLVSTALTLTVSVP